MTGATVALAIDDPLIDLSEMLVDEAMALHGIDWTFVPPKPQKRKRGRKPDAAQRSAFDNITRPRSSKDEWSALEPSEL